MGKATVDYIACDKPIQLIPQELDRCQKFHQFLFEEVIRIRKDTKFTKNESTKYYLVVPLRHVLKDKL